MLIKEHVSKAPKGQYPVIGNRKKNDAFRNWWRLLSSNQMESLRTSIPLTSDFVDYASAQQIIAKSPRHPKTPTGRDKNPTTTFYSPSEAEPRTPKMVEETPITVGPSGSTTKVYRSIRVPMPFPLISFHLHMASSHIQIRTFLGLNPYLSPMPNPVTRAKEQVLIRRWVAFFTAFFSRIVTNKQRRTPPSQRLMQKSITLHGMRPTIRYILKLLAHFFTRVLFSICYEPSGPNLPMITFQDLDLGGSQSKQGFTF